MRIKLDENLPYELVHVLTGAGHDVHTIPDESLVGQNDLTVFAATCREGRVLITQDLDFSDVRKFKPGTHPGIILVRLRQPSRRRIVDRFRQIVSGESIDRWSKCFVVISDKKLRIRRP
jgi:predicted nuclease of predicted toxin-antitoxin system